MGLTICFLSLTDYCPILFVVHCLKTIISFMLFDFVVETNLVSVPSSQPKELCIVFSD